MFIGMSVSNKKVIKSFENIEMVSGTVNGVEDLVWTEIGGRPIDTDHIGWPVEVALEDFETAVRYNKLDKEEEGKAKREAKRS